MDGWMDGWIPACMHACMHACMYGCVDVWMYGCTHACIYIYIINKYIYIYNQIYTFMICARYDTRWSRKQQQTYSLGNK